MGCGTSYDEDYVGQFNQNSQVASQQSNQDNQQQKFHTGQKLTLKICTMNFGEYKSPFKLFHRSFKRLGQEDVEDLQKQEKEQRKLNDKFVEICQRQRYNYKIKQKYISQNLIKLQKISKQRYTVLYNKNVGIKKDDTLMSEKQFVEEWQKKFVSIQKQIAKDPTLQFDLGIEQQFKLAKKQLLKFDTICYHTLLSYVYEMVSLDAITTQNFAYKYSLFMNSKFSKSQFDSIEKIKNLENFLKKLSIDIAFAHEITPKYMKQIRQQFSSFRIVEPSGNGTSAIFIKSQLINKLQPKYRNYTLSGLNFRYIESLDQNISNNYEKNEERNVNEVLRQIKIRRQRQQKQKQKHMTDIKHRQSISFGNQSAMKQSKFQASQMISTFNHQHTNDLNQSLISQSEENIEVQEKPIISSDPRITIKKKDKLTIQQLNNFRLTEDCVLQFVGCFILISMRISQYSEMKDKKLKSSVNIDQIERIKKVLIQLKKRFPRHRIIVGLNTPVSREQQIKDQFLDHLQVFREKYKHKQQPFCFVPDVYSLVDDYEQEDRHMIGKQKLKRVVQKKGYYTSIYKKTNFNIDRKQINYEYTGVDSFLISNGKLQNPAVYNCTAEKISDQSAFQNFIQYTPNQKHPFASLFIYSELQVQLLEVAFNND